MARGAATAVAPTPARSLRMTPSSDQLLIPTQEGVSEYRLYAPKEPV